MAATFGENARRLRRHTGTDVTVTSRVPGVMKRVDALTTPSEHKNPTLYGDSSEPIVLLLGFNSTD